MATNKIPRRLFREGCFGKGRFRKDCFGKGFLFRKGCFGKGRL